jgi:hypothetical protein
MMDWEEPAVAVLSEDEEAEGFCNASGNSDAESCEDGNGVG